LKSATQAKLNSITTAGYTNINFQPK